MISVGDSLASPDEAEEPLGPLPEVDAEFMKWVVPTTSRKEVDRAGRRVADWFKASTTAPESPEIEKAFEVVDSWRAAHVYPLKALRQTLINRARRIDSDATVVQRLKRLSSIMVKLDRNPHMKFSQMQDIGGCRAIVSTVQRVRRLTELYHAGIGPGHELVDEDDYITNPKLDGYRGHHLICKFRSDQPVLAELSRFNLRIELQVRTRLQHAWATAVEVADTFNSRQIKTGTGDQKWIRFFALMGTVIADIEKQPPVPGTPDNRAELKAELRQHYEDLDIPTFFEGTINAPNLRDVRNVRYFMLILDPEKRQTEVVGFREHQLKALVDRAERRERKAMAQKSRKQVVVVTATSYRELLVAYPNYQLDAGAFLGLVRNAIRSNPIKSAALVSSSASP